MEFVEYILHIIDVFYTFESDDEDEDEDDRGGGSDDDSHLLEWKTTKKGLTFLDKKLNLTGVLWMVTPRRIELRSTGWKPVVLTTGRWRQVLQISRGNL